MSWYDGLMLVVFAFFGVRCLWRLVLHIRVDVALLNGRRDLRFPFWSLNPFGEFNWIRKLEASEDPTRRFALPLRWTLISAYAAWGVLVILLVSRASF